jgi:F-type H+-transporting ATPase subunit epsilon
MTDALRLKVVTPKGCAVDETATAFTARSEVGEFCILPGHALLLTSIAAGRMIVKTEEGGPKTFALDNGFLEAGPDRVQVITDHCQAAEDVDEEAVRQEIASLEDQLKADDLSPADRAALNRKLAWAEARLGVVG